MHEQDTTAAAPAPPSSAVYGTVMASLLALAILYAIAAYVQWTAWLPGGAS
jgi:hypothetical protein